MLGINKLNFNLDDYYTGVLNPTPCFGRRFNVKHKNINTGNVIFLSEVSLERK